MFEVQPPLEVFVSPRAEQAYGDVYVAGYEFMKATKSPTPYVGLMLRDGIPEDLAEAMQDPDLDISFRARHQSYYLQPLNLAMQQASKELSLTPGFEVSDLTYCDEINSCYTAPHTDQILNRATDPIVPLFGPLSAVATIYGSVNYKLWVDPVDVFDTNQWPDLEDAVDMPTAISRNLTQFDISAGPRDILAFSNNPPTIHMAQSSVARLSIACFSYLEAKKTVE